MSDLSERVAGAHAAQLLAAAPAPVVERLLEKATVGLMVFDDELRLRRCNQVAAAIAGAAPADLLGAGPAAVFGEAGAAVECALRSVLSAGAVVRDAELAASPQAAAAGAGSARWLVDYVPLFDGADGARATGVAVLMVASSRPGSTVDAELRTLYRALPMGVGFLGLDLRFLRVNDALAAMHGIPAADHVGAPLRDILGEDATTVADAMRSVLATRRPAEFELDVSNLQDPSRVRSVEASYFPVVGDGGDLLGVGAVVRDVTERRALEEARRALLQEALAARAEAEAAQERADAARREAERAREEAELGRSRLAFLAEAGRRMSESIDWESTLQAVVRSAVPALADWTSLTMLESDGSLRVAAVAHSDSERERLAWELVARYPADPAAPGGAPHVIRTGELELVKDIAPEVVRAAAQDDEHLRLLENLNVRHYAIAPLATPSGVIGALTFVLGDTDRRFTAADLQLIVGLAARAGLHIQNARLYTQRSHVAEVLQASLRPSALPRIPGAEVAGRFVAAGDGIEVGGDFYDVFGSGDGVWTAIMGDVAGKGPEAAAVTAHARHTLRTASLLHDDPAANLALLNQALMAEVSDQHLCTVFYARLRPEARGIAVTFANGGHPPPLLLRADGRIETLREGRGPLAGAFADARYEAAGATLAPGDLLLMYTDGVTEIRPSDIAFGERRLRNRLAECAGRPAAEVVEDLLRHTLELQDGTPRDDIALLAVRSPAT